MLDGNLVVVINCDRDYVVIKHCDTGVEQPLAIEVAIELIKSYNLGT